MVDILESHSIHNFHNYLEVILNPLQQNQGATTPIYANICSGDKVAFCHVFFPVAYGMGDGLYSDKMCGQFLGYSNINRLSRFCNISFYDPDDPNCTCKQISIHCLQQKSNKALKLFGLMFFDNRQYSRSKNIEEIAIESEG